MYHVHVCLYAKRKWPSAKHSIRRKLLKIVAERTYLEKHSRRLFKNDVELVIAEQTDCCGITNGRLETIILSASSAFNDGVSWLV